MLCISKPPLYNRQLVGYVQRVTTIYRFHCSEYVTYLTGNSTSNKIDFELSMCDSTLSQTL